ncbi:hypothetical protein EI555_001292, partial [Monodon monoceros]
APSASLAIGPRAPGRQCEAMPPCLFEPARQPDPGWHTWSTCCFQKGYAPRSPGKNRRHVPHSPSSHRAQVPSVKGKTPLVFRGSPCFLT